MAHQHREDEGNEENVYRIRPRRGPFGARVRVFDDAVPPVPVVPPLAHPAPGGFDLVRAGMIARLAQAAGLDIRLPGLDAAADAPADASTPPDAAPATSAADAPDAPGAPDAAPIPDAATAPTPAPTSPDAPAPAKDEAAPLAYGWVERALPVPRTGGGYVVEFVDAEHVRLLAYVDPFGRAFSVDEPVQAPPACDPDLQIAKVADADEDGAEVGEVFVADGGDPPGRDVAHYRLVKGAYDVDDTWFDFGAHATGIDYVELMARSYLAFVHRPSLGAPAVPTSGIARVLEGLSANTPLSDLQEFAREVRHAKADPRLQLPALIECLATWLEEAGLDAIAARRVPDDAVRLVRSTTYAHMRYLAPTDDDGAVGRHALWALEAVLNRFALVEEALDDCPEDADMDACLLADETIREQVALQHVAGGTPHGAPEGEPGGAWALRCAIGMVIEQLRLPYRVEATFAVDEAAGAVAFDLTVPDASLMPRGGGRLGGRLANDADSVARRYAMHVALLLAAETFKASAQVKQVNVTARALSRDEGAASGSGDGAASDARAHVDAAEPALFCFSLDRGTWERTDGFMDARANDPRPFLASCGMHEDVKDAPALVCSDVMAPVLAMRGLPEAGDAELGRSERAALGARAAREVRIEYDAAYRRMAEELADRLTCAEGTLDAISMVREVQSAAVSRTDERAASGCTRLMTALAEGTLDAHDQNAAVGLFLGEDRCLVALGRAHGLAERDPDAAASVLADAIAEASALDGFVDGRTTVYRSFDSYAGRVLYNLARAGRPGLARRAAADAGKQVELVPDSFYLCHLELVQLLERSFDRSDEALRYGQRAVELAPATASGFRQLGRAYMLVGDMESAEKVLCEGLLMAVQPADIAILYYQLAYVLWKLGRANAGATCYLKSLSSAPTVAVQATSELQRLMSEASVNVPSHDEVDARLREAGIPVAPTDAVLDALEAGAAAAADAGLAPVARGLLAVRLRYRPDDALLNVLRSFVAQAR